MGGPSCFSCIRSCLVRNLQVAITHKEKLGNRTPSSAIGKTLEKFGALGYPFACEETKACIENSLQDPGRKVHA